MSTTVSLTRSDLIDEALAILYRSSERPRPVAVGSDALADASDTQLTLAAGDDDLVYVTSVLENGQELMLVTGKSTDATPVYTVSRSYAGTTASAGSTYSQRMLPVLWIG